jgi:hypothetical protein
MYPINTTPAECLLQRLLHSEKLKDFYHFAVEREENCTSIYIHLYNPERNQVQVPAIEENGTANVYRKVFKAF